MNNESTKLTDLHQAYHPEEISEEQAIEAENELTKFISLLIEIDNS